MADQVLLDPELHVESAETDDVLTSSQLAEGRQSHWNKWKKGFNCFKQCVLQTVMKQPLS
eukprot:454481-Amphidinium_carterae.1